MGRIYLFILLRWLMRGGMGMGGIDGILGDEGDVESFRDTGDEGHILVVCVIRWTGVWK